MADTMISAGGGLSNSKLKLATATVADVVSGKTFYAGDKTIKTGTHKVTILTLATKSGDATVNVKDKCSNWANLTSKNFFISINYSSLYHRFPGGSDPHADIKVYAPSVSYNASTGDVTVNRGYIWCEGATSGGSKTGTADISWTLYMAF